MFFVFFCLTMFKNYKIGFKNEYKNVLLLFKKNFVMKFSKKKWIFFFTFSSMA